jgi:hypothetical protein
MTLRTGEERMQYFVSVQLNSTGKKRKGDERKGKASPNCRFSMLFAMLLSFLSRSAETSSLLSLSKRMLSFAGTLVSS